MRSSVDAADLGNFIREQRRVARLSVRKLSELAGVSNPYLSQIERGLRKPSAEILQALARGLRISAETLYVRAGFLEHSPAKDGDLTSSILNEPNLTDEQKHSLLTVYRSFRDANVKVSDTENVATSQSFEVDDSMIADTDAADAPE